MATMLQENLDKAQRVVQLSLDVNYNGEVTLKLVRFDLPNISLVRMDEQIAVDEDGSPVLTVPERFTLSGDELDTLLVEWQAFKSAIEAFQAEKAARREARKAEALALAASVKTELDSLNIVIEPDEYWGAEHFRVKVPALSIDSGAHTDNLLSVVEQVIERVERHIRKLEDTEESYKDRYWSQEQRTKFEAQISAWRAVRPRSEEKQEADLPDFDEEEV